MGHLIDKCNGGLDSPDNLVVMHHFCNTHKPRHESIEQAMRWKLNPTPQETNKEIIITENNRCPTCLSTNIIKDGTRTRWRKHVKRRVPYLMCNNCGKQFQKEYISYEEVTKT